MKVSLLTGNLQKKLSLVNHAISSRNQLPILSHILLHAFDGKLFLSATDLEIGIETMIPASIEEEGITTVPAKLFSELINALPEEKITLTTIENSLEVKSSKTKSILQTGNKEEFPMLYEEKGELLLQISAEDLHKNLFSVVFSASVETTRPALSGVFFQKSPEGGVFVATDGYRLSLQKLLPQVITEAHNTKGIIIPGRVIKEALSLKESKEVFVFIDQKANQILFEQGETVLVGRLIDAEFPDYQKILPGEAATRVFLDHEELLKAVKTCAIFARETGNIMKLSLQKDRIIVSAKTAAVGENTVEVEAALDGEENEIAFNARYLLDALQGIEGQELLFEMTGPLNPGVFKIKGDDSFLHLIMPIRL